MTLDDLRAFGANVDEGVGRCMGNEEFYLRLVETAKGEAGFDQLFDAVQENRLEDAFSAAHSLKGILGNLALTPLYVPMSEITELLRKNTQMDYTPLVDTIRQELDRFLAL